MQILDVYARANRNWTLTIDGDVKSFLIGISVSFFFNVYLRVLSAEMTWSQCLQTNLWIGKLNIYLSNGILSKARSKPQKPRKSRKKQLNKVIALSTTKKRIKDPFDMTWQEKTKKLKIFRDFRVFVLSPTLKSENWEITKIL